MPFCLSLCLMASCVDDVTNVKEQYPQQWQLLRMTGSLDDAIKTGDRLEWQEFYLLKADGTFLKSRLDDGVKTFATGSFTFEEKEDEYLLLLTYDAPTEIIGGCEPEPRETLILLSDDLLVSTWPACDGPGLEYYRTQ